MHQIKIGLLIANGFEEIETITPYDIFMRAGIEVELISVSQELEICSDRNLKIECHKTLDDVHMASLSALFIPGGKGGVESLGRVSELQTLFEYFSVHKLPVFSICAAPLLHARLGFFKGHPLTGHPSIKKELLQLGYAYEDKIVVKSENLWTSQGAGTSAHFCFEIISKFCGQELSDEIRQAMVY